MGHFLNSLIVRIPCFSLGAQAVLKLLDDTLSIGLADHLLSPPLVLLHVVLRRPLGD